MRQQALFHLRLPFRGLARLYRQRIQRTLAVHPDRYMYGADDSKSEMTESDAWLATANEIFNETLSTVHPLQYTSVHVSNANVTGR